VFAGALGTAQTTGKAVELEQAFDLPEGVRWWRLTVKPVTADGEAPGRFLVTGVEITQRVELERRLAEAGSRFESVVDATYDGIVTIDQREKITLFNKAAEEIFGFRADEIVGRSITDLVPLHARSRHGDHVDRFAGSPIASRQMHERRRVNGRRKDGSEFPAEVAIAKIYVAGRLEFTAIVRDVSERVRLLDELERRAATDALTGLPNRRELDERASELLRETRKVGRPLSLVTLDVDRFKDINDTHGHDVGDEVLKALATVAAATVHHNDVFARVGGEEFTALLPGASLESAAKMAERLRAIFSTEDFTYPWRGRKIRFTVSIGVATVRADEPDLVGAGKRADDALYRAKKAGRDRVEVE
jgi:diguanylate cyclase (GGDEF)-like protein/PAS domain S-box-containing protein